LHRICDIVTFMRSIDKMAGILSRTAPSAGPECFRQLGVAVLALVLIVALPVVVWGSDGSTDADPANPAPVVNQESNTDPRINERPVTPAASLPGEKINPAEVDASKALSDEYDLALGKSVFNHTCLTCHGNSVRDAPRVGDMHVWQSRLTQGLDVLIEHALNGHGRMPAKGGYSTLTDHQVSSAVAYVYETGTEILAKQDKPTPHEGCDPLSNLDQCSPEEIKRLLVLQMLWLLGGPHQ
jgi:cytochrome c5